MLIRDPIDLPEQVHRGDFVLRLLQHDARARAVRELAPVVARSSKWTEDRRFLLVPYHMIGARSMERREQTGRPSVC